MSSEIDRIESELQHHQCEEVALQARRFFKSAPGQYGEGDHFIGVKAPQIRTIASHFCNATLESLKNLLYSKVHEARYLALCIIILQYEKSPKAQKSLFDFYIKHLDCINNWDLVDISAPKIVGHHA